MCRARTAVNRDNTERNCAVRCSSGVEAGSRGVVLGDESRGVSGQVQKLKFFVRTPPHRTHSHALLCPGILHTVAPLQCQQPAGLSEFRPTGTRARARARAGTGHHTSPPDPTRTGTRPHRNRTPQPPHRTSNTSPNVVLSRSDAPLGPTARPVGRCLPG